MSEQEQLFDLSLTEEQLLTRESLRRFAEAELRAFSRPADESKAAPEGFYDKTMELGLSLMPIPEALGGAGMERSPISNMLNAEDLAYGDMSLALGAVTPLSFINTVLDNGSEAQIEKYLTPLADEKFVPATVALMEGKATFEPTRLSTSAKKDGDKYIINGEKTMVILGKSAELILVIAEEEGQGPQAFIVEKNAEGLTCEEELYMGLNPIEKTSLKFENLSVDASAKLGEGKGFDLQRMVDLARIGTCALSVGAAKSVLDYVIPYVNERVAFGEPISHRQAVAFMVADIRIELDAMQLMTYRAASRAEQGLDFHKEAYLARVFCAERSMEIGTNGVQLLGGHGFCREHPVELWYRNLRAAGVLEGACVI
jgi:alkylation response protein AidB-like acyl-CoA dehydrogenase